MRKTKFSNDDIEKLENNQNKTQFSEKKRSRMLMN